MTFGTVQADRYLTDLGHVFELIAAFPEIGRIYDGETRQFVHGRHIILYRMLGTRS